VDVLGSVMEPYLHVLDEHVLAMMVRHGAIEVGARRSSMRVTFQAGEMVFFLVTRNDGSEPATRSVCSSTFPIRRSWHFVMEYPTRLEEWQHCVTYGETSPLEDLDFKRSTIFTALGRKQQFWDAR